MKHWKNPLPGCIAVLYVCIFGFIIADLLIIDRRLPLDYLSVALPNRTLAIPALASIFAVLFFARRHGGQRAGRSKPADNGRALTRRYALACLALFGLQLLVAASIWFYVGFDVGIVRISAQCFVSGDPYAFAAPYFGTNPNNLGIYFLTILFLRLGDMLRIDGYLLLIFFGVLLANLAVFFTGRCVWKLTKDPRAVWTGFVFSCLLFGLSPWITVPYTDTFSLLLPVLSFDIYLTVQDSRLPLFAKTAAVAAVPTLGLLIKPTNAIVLIAVCAAQAAHADLHRLSWKPVLSCLSALLLCFVCLSAARLGIRAYTGIAEDEQNEKTFLHYAMMGANADTVGGYNKKDDAYTSGFPGRELKNKKDLERLTQRLKDMGVSGYAVHVAKKTLKNFNNGTFGWGREKSDFTELIPTRASRLAAFFQNIYYVDTGNDDYLMGNGGRYYPYYVVTVQFVWLTCLFLCLFAPLSGVLRNRDGSALMLSLIGIFLMVTIFETNSRYLLSYVPLFVTMAAAAIWGKTKPR